MHVFYTVSTVKHTKGTKHLSDYCNASASSVPSMPHATWTTKYQKSRSVDMPCSQPTRHASSRDSIVPPCDLLVMPTGDLLVLSYSMRNRGTWTCTFHPFQQSARPSDQLLTSVGIPATSKLVPASTGGVMWLHGIVNRGVAREAVSLHVHCDINRRGMFKLWRDILQRCVGFGMRSPVPHVLQPQCSNKSWGSLPDSVG